MMGLFQDLVAIQREIYLAFADRIGTFAETGDWTLLAAYFPMGILFGAVHALTPGHSKAVLATYLTGSTATVPRALLVSFVLSFTHVTMSVVIALLSLPLVSVALGSVGRAPLLEDVSRGLVGLLGLWMLWQGIRGSGHFHAQEGSLVGFMAGLIPCPLTLFVMTFAISRGVPEAGVAFAAVMMIGVALVLSAVALAAVLFRQQLLSARAAIATRSATTGYWAKPHADTGAVWTSCATSGHSLSFSETDVRTVIRATQTLFHRAESAWNLPFVAPGLCSPPKRLNTYLSAPPIHALLTIEAPRSSEATEPGVSQSNSPVM